MSTEAKPANVARILVPIGAALALIPVVPLGAALVAGAVVALSVGNPYAAKTRALSGKLLQFSVIGLGAGMNLGVIARAGAHGVLTTAFSIAACLTLGIVLGRALRTPANTSLLISVGTAICGGSAIAAVAPVLKPKDEEISIALAVVFLLNAIALVIFPIIGHAFHLNEDQFGLWAALAIHDTSSVVGASMAYGNHALEVATTVKLTRALWIVPVTLGVAQWVARRDARLADTAHAVSSKDATKAATSKAPKPWFLAGFLIAAALVTYIPALHAAGHVVSEIAKRAMATTLFLIGTGLTQAALRAVGVRPLVQALTLWIVVSIGALAAIATHVIG